ncbi:ScyD/ScyE family protein [Pedococcus ginsenosidimutans]|jgi:hypothetical protein|uniref:ScyD/ScyE family protein n=1 Tax=Pedococcus ginsenosidimutans TaxID=490570 RepID=A0ABN3C0U5_9MICO
MRSSRWSIAVAVASATALIAAPAASAHAGSAARTWTPKVLNSEVVAPFHLATNDGRLYVADGGTSTVSRVNGDGSLTMLAQGPMPGEVSGVAKTDNALAYTTLDYTTGEATLTVKRGSKTMVANLTAFETRRNPDQRVHYGFKDPSCANGALGDLAAYTGQVDSHAYAVTRWNGAWVVADAGGNDLVKVDDNGHVSLLSLLPPQPLLVSQEFADANGIPDCAGQRYKFEPVPTDVEVGMDGMLYVSTLPGGPEDPSAGARGSVYKVNPWTGAATRVATGFAGATSVTQGSDGTLYVAELFGGKVTAVRNGHKSTAAMLPGALAVEYGNGHLYAGTLAPTDDQGNPTGTGSIVRIR